MLLGNSADWGSEGQRSSSFILSVRRPVVKCVVLAETREMGGQADRWSGTGEGWEGDRRA